MEWYDLGLISKEDTEGIELEWGNYKAALEMVRKIACREGFGNVLAEGPLRAAANVGKGAEKYLTSSKGGVYQIDANHYRRGYSLAYATSTRGADHLRGIPTTIMLAGKDVEETKRRFGPDSLNDTSYKDKAPHVQYSQRVCTIADAMEVCKFATEWLGQELSLTEMAELFSAITGIEMDESHITDAADRIWTVERAFLVREGITRKDDAVVGRLREQPQPSGQHKGIAHDQKGWDEMLDEYYELVGWDKETGAPTLSRLETLGLKDIAEELKKMGKL
jgi:aldehyde:ferredoxin oxidoreductase